MNTNWDIYNKRLNANGSSERDRQLNRLKTNITNHADHSLSYKSVRLNGVETNLIINTGTKSYYKEFESLPNQTVLCGDYIEWANRTWLVYEADADDEVYIDGKMYECNYIQRWQNEKGEIISRPSFVLNASAYNNGEKGNNTITLASNQFMVYMPIDEETIKLRNGKRMFMDYYLEESSVYKLTRPDNVSMHFGDKGVTYYIFTQTESNATSDKDKLITLDDGTQVWIADYQSPTIPTEPEIPDEMTDLTVIISGNQNLKVGFSRTYTATIADVNGNAVEWDDTYSWNVVADFEVGQEETNNKITLFIEDEELIGSSFILQVFSDNNGVIGQITITVAELM